MRATPCRTQKRMRCPAGASRLSGVVSAKTHRAPGPLFRNLRHTSPATARRAPAAHPCKHGGMVHHLAATLDASTTQRDRRTAYKYTVARAPRQVSCPQTRQRPAAARVHCRGNRGRATPSYCRRGDCCRDCGPYEDRELAQLFAGKFASAPRTKPGIHFERLPPIGLLLLRLVAPHFGDYPILAVKILRVSSSITYVHPPSARWRIHLPLQASGPIHRTIGTTLTFSSRHPQRESLPAARPSH